MITCAGCGKDDKECGYGPDNPVTGDGSYSYTTNQFVCDECYIVLIHNGLDVGRPEQLQTRIKNLNASKR